MDTAGTIIGAISLSITLCQGITTYCHDWKHQDEEVRSLRSLCDGLVQHLQAIDQVVKDHPTLNPNTVTRLDDALNTCNEHCETVLLLSRKYATEQPAASWKGKAREGARKLKFPFQKKTLEELKDIMMAFRSNVDGILQLLNLENVLVLREDGDKHRIAILEEVRSTGSQVSQTVTTAMGQRITALENHLSEKIDSSTISITTGAKQSAMALSQSLAAEISQTILPTHGASVAHSITGEVDSVRSSIETSVSNSTREILSAINVQAQVAEQMSMTLASLVRGDSDAKMPYFLTAETADANYLAPFPVRRKTKPGNRGQHLARRVFADCICGPNARCITSTTSTQSSRWIFSNQTESLVHKRDCPLWYQSQVARRYGFRFALLQRLGVFGSVSIDASPYRSVFRWGISQSLAFRPIVSKDSAAFKVITHYFKWYDEVDPGSCVRDLMAVFRNGRGSPTDTLLDGTTLFQHAFDEFNGYHPSGISTLWTLTRQLHGRGVKISFDLGRSRGSPWHSLNGQIFTKLDPSGSRIASTALAFFTWLDKHDVEIIPPERYVDSLVFSPFGSNYQFRLVLDALRSQEDLREAAQCGILSTAVLQRDRPTIEKILNRHPELLYTERDVFGHCPIHHSIGWLEGLQLLLGVADEATLDEGVKGAERKITFLDSAIAYGCKDSIRLLLDAGIAFNMSWCHHVGTDVLNPDISKLVAEAIVARLRQLVEFSERNLPEKVLASLNIPDRSSPDSNARILLNALYTEGVQLPKRFHSPHPLLSQDFWFRHGTLYHMSDLGYNTAMAFFEAGLKDVDCMAEGITPLMGLGAPLGNHSRFFRMVEFFVEKGGRLDRQIPSKLIQRLTSGTENANNYQVIHRLSVMAWDNVAYSHNAYILKIAELGRSHIWRGIFNSRFSDRCNCACASGGCRPISLALKSFAFPLIHRHTVDWGSIFNPQNRETMLQLLHKQTYLLDGLDGYQVVEDVIRFLSFSALGLTHTCCKYTLSSHFGFSQNLYKPKAYIELMDSTEVEEIRHEDASLIRRLDSLVDDFMQAFRELELPLGRFLLRYWQETMLAELSAEDEVPEPVRKEWEDIGVVIGDIRPKTPEKAYEVPRSWLERKEEEERAYTKWIEGIRDGIGPA